MVRNFFPVRTCGTKNLVIAFRAALQHASLALGDSPSPEREYGMASCIRNNSVRTHRRYRNAGLCRSIEKSPTNIKCSLSLISSSLQSAFIFLIHPMTPPFCESRNATHVASKLHTTWLGIPHNGRIPWRGNQSVVPGTLSASKAQDRRVSRLPTTFPVGRLV